MSAMQLPQLTLLCPLLHLGNNLHVVFVSGGCCKHCFESWVQMYNILLAQDHVEGALQGGDTVSHALHGVVTDAPLGTGQGAPAQGVGYSLALARRPLEGESVIQGVHSNLKETIGKILQRPREQGNEGLMIDDYCCLLIPSEIKIEMAAGPVNHDACYARLGLCGPATCFYYIKYKYTEYCKN